MRRLPLRLRVVALTSVAALITSLVVGSIAFLRADSDARRELDVFLSQEAAEALALVSAGGRFESLVDINSTVGPSQRIALYAPDGELVDGTSILPPTPDLTSGASRFESMPDPSGPETMRTIVVPVDVGGQPRVLVLATSLDFVASRVRSSLAWILPLMLMAVLAVAAGTYIVTGLVLRPIEGLRSSAERLARNPEGRRLAVPEPRDEVRALAETINEALQTVDDTMESHREFVAEASHELRSPLARLSADIEYASRPTRTPEEVAEKLDSVARHTADLTMVADNLLDLLENRVAPPTGIHTVGEVVADVRSRVDDRPRLAVDVDADVVHARLVCDVDDIGGAIRNLVDNAYDHGAEPVRFSVFANTRTVTFAVEDAGPGIPSTRIDELRRPFVRGPGEGGRAGLGLAIVSRIVERHGGTLAIEAGMPSRISILLPRQSSR